MTDDATKQLSEEQKEQIEAVYRKYAEKMRGLQKEQDEILESFLREIEASRIDEIRDHLKTI